MSLRKDFYGDPLSLGWAESDSPPTDSLVLEDPLNMEMICLTQHF